MFNLESTKPILAKYFERPDTNNFDGSFNELEDFYCGRQSIIIKPDKLNEYCDLTKMYPKNDVTLKIFGSGGKVARISTIQNIFYNLGFAPLVYDVGKIDGYDAQIVEFAEGGFCYDEIRMKEIYNLMIDRISEKYIYQSCDLYPSNIIGGKWIDFGNFDFADFQRYKTDVAIKFNNFAVWGNGKNAYQDLSEFNIKGARGSVRSDIFDLGSFDFKNKTVLDIGCSGGWFTNYCKKKGARAIGIDKFDVASVAREASNALGYFAEFYSYDLNKDNFEDFIYKLTGIKKFDYVFFLSMDQHVGLKDYLPRIGKNLFFESNGGKPVEEEFDLFEASLKKMYEVVKFKGVSQEGAKRNLFYCSN